MLAGQSLSQVRLALSLALEQAQWAALNGQAAVYSQVLDEARDILKGNFNPDNAQSKVMLEQVGRAEQATGHRVDAGYDGYTERVQGYLERRNVNAEDSVKPLAKPAANTAPEATP